MLGTCSAHTNSAPCTENCADVAPWRLDHRTTELTQQSPTLSLLSPLSPSSQQKPKWRCFEFFLVRNTTERDETAKEER